DQDKEGEKPQPAQQGDGGKEGNDAGPETDGIPPLAELKMLLALQREILEQTTRLHELRASGKSLTPAQQQELEALAREQVELADLARNLSRLATEPPDEPQDEGTRQSPDTDPK